MDDGPQTVNARGPVDGSREDTRPASARNVM